MTPDIDLGVVLLPGRDASGTLELVRLCESVGIGFVGIADSQCLWEDVYVLLGAASVMTSRLRLGPYVTNARTRHETVIANAMATVQRLSGGRAFLGIGYGDSSVKTVGLRPQHRRELAESVGRMRRLLSGDEVSAYDGDGTWRLVGEPTPLEIWWAADGQRSLEDGGSFADLVIANSLLLPDYLRFVADNIARGAAVAGRVELPDVVVQTGIVIDDDGSRARSVARPYVARTLCRDVSRWIPDWTEERSRAFRERYDYFHHMALDHEIAELVPDEVVTRKAVAGTPGECADQLRGILKSGVHHISLLILNDAAETVRRLGDEVLPML